MDLKKLEKLLTDEPNYRKIQVKKALYKDLILGWDEATNLPKKLRESLRAACPLEIEARSLESTGGKTIKTQIWYSDGLSIEAVLMKHTDRRNTVCVSTQVGCPLGCRFCITGEMGFKRNLSAFEIVEQVLYFARGLRKDNERVTNVVFMGMGEPFLNYENVIEAVQLLNDKDGLDIGARKISISTAGILEGIRKLSEEKLQVNLAISLHAPNDELRTKLMPINKKYPLKQILQSVDDYVKKTNRKVMFEYVLIEGVNDLDEQARALAEILQNPLYMINLIQYNPTGKYKPSKTDRIKSFKKILEERGKFTTQRYRFGSDIEAACGQLASRKLN